MREEVASMKCRLQVQKVMSKPSAGDEMSEVFMIGAMFDIQGEN